MAKPKRHGALMLRSAAASIPSKSQSSTYPSACPSDDESSHGTWIQPFRFLDLPSELRNKIYHMVFVSASTAFTVIDLDPSIFSFLNRTKILSLFRVSKQINRETTHHFFSTHTFRLFPTYPGRYFKTKKPLLARLPAHYRASITSLQLRLGPGWNNPPRGWVVNDALGLADCKNVRVLKIYVENDPSDAIYQGFRAGDGFYEGFCAGLLEDILKDTPSIEVAEFDAYPAVNRNGDMMSGLGAVVAKYDKVVAWGPERGWKEESDQVWQDAILRDESGKKLSKSVVVFG